MSNEQPEKIRPTDLAAKLGCSVAYASQLLSGARKPPIPRAIEIFDLAGVKVGPLEGKTDEQVALLRDAIAA
jgi:transcriptional regulator with XRE-family HTH domain